MNKEDIRVAHKLTKSGQYWNNLVSGNTGVYKGKVIDHLLEKHAPYLCEKILDIGCGTCELIFKYKEKFHAKRTVCMDYDAKVIHTLREKHKGMDIDWVVQDVFGLEKWNESFDLIFLLDMIHEVYSFYGRLNQDISTEVNNQLGLQCVRALLRQVASVTSVGGCVVITDNVLCEEDVAVLLEIRSEESRQAVEYVCQKYATRTLRYRLFDNNKIEINSRDLCLLLSQYNKVKNKDWDRWNVERLEVHQYFTLREYQAELENLGFKFYSVVGTPLETYQEWSSDFKILAGLPNFPQKRITVLAKKER